MSSALPSRYDFIDAARAFALVLGIVFHACLSFLPVFVGWAVQDISTSPFVSVFAHLSHSFRMELFFLLAGFLSQQALARHGVKAYIGSRLIRLLVPFLVGWFILRPLLVSGWVMGSASLRGDVEIGPALLAGIKSLHDLPAGLLTGTHLWFLYYLLLITGLFLVVRSAIFHLEPLGRAVGKLEVVLDQVLNSRWKWPALLLPTSFALLSMQQWGMDTPDRSLVPHLPVLFIYSGFFGLGWWCAIKPERMDCLSRLSLSTWLVAAAGVGGSLLLVPLQGQPSSPHFALAHYGFVLMYASMMWGVVLLTLGVFRAILPTHESTAAIGSRVHGSQVAIRYLADSAYWLYLTHLPLVIWLQVALAEVALPWWAKLWIISTLTCVLLLVTYDLFVRSTWIGRLLSGRQRPRVLFRSRPLETAGQTC